MDPWSWIAIGVIGTLLAITPLWLRARRSSAAAHALDQLDTLTTWPPEPTRVLDIHERLALQALARALPGHMLLAAVPLANFLNVPRRHSYAEWLKRAGHLSVDLMVCDPSSHVVAVVLLRKPNDTAKRLRRLEQIARVVSAARVRVLFWTSGALPAQADIIEALKPHPRAANGGAAPAEDTATAPSPVMNGLGLPLPLVVESHTGAAPATGRETPASTWFDDLEPGDDASRRRRSAGW